MGRHGQASYAPPFYRAASMVPGHSRADLLGSAAMGASGLHFSPVGSVSPPIVWPVKRTTDVVLALCGLLALAPLFTIIALLIRLSGPGPVFFRQQREGLNGRTIGVLKFRSMHWGPGGSGEKNQSMSDGLRITRLGRFLRRTSIDELPQLINVLLGEMSLVGPRPHVPDMVAGGVSYRELVPYYEARHGVRPGMTGWAQVNGLRGPIRDASNAIARIDHDLAYIQNWSFALDMRILAMTVWRELTLGTGS